MKFDPDLNRYEVRLDHDGNIKKVKEDNLRVRCFACLKHIRASIIAQANSRVQNCTSSPIFRSMIR